MKPDEFETFLFDLNGTLTNWNRTIIGAEDLVHSARQGGADVAFLTDNSLLSAEKWASKLRKMGLYTDEDYVVTAGGAVNRKFRSKGIGEGFVMGSSHLHDEVEFRSSKASDHVVLGFDKKFNYRKIQEGSEILEKGKLHVLSRQERLRMPEKTIPHQKSMNDALANFAEPELVGKPSADYANHVKEKVSFRPGKTLVVGDRLDDVRLGRELGAKTALVMSGDTEKSELKQLEGKDKPDFGISNLSRLTRQL